MNMIIFTLAAALTTVAVQANQVSESQQKYVKKYAKQKNVPNPADMLINTSREPKLTNGFTSLYNGKNLDGWKLIDPNNKNGFIVENGVLINKPVQEAGHHVRYGNIRTEQEFEDFNLKLEVKVPSGDNSGIYLRGMYEIQVFDSYGKELDPHNMGALYSRITPAVAAEKPAGEWQSLDITLWDRHLTIILNGKTIIDNQPVYGPTGGAISADVFAPGPIYLQGDHGTVYYRNMVLRPIRK